MKRIWLTCSLLAWFAPVAAFAQAPRDGRTGARAPRVETHDFDDHNLIGNTVAPVGEVLQVRRRSERGTLITVRAHFIRELRGAVETM